MHVQGKKVFLGLSGGVDSAVSAALLKGQGAQVIGVFIQGWYPPGMPCTWAEDRRDAMRVAAHLQIPFLTLDASSEYKKGVIDYLLAEYAAGRTPNPDVMCNKEVKFGVFYDFAMAHGADCIATGHYVSGEKDQRYFLWAVPKEVLGKTVFPVGNMEKSDVRRLAKQFGLPVSGKPDSQGVCFLGSVSVKEFLRQELGEDAALLHTVGERVDGKFVVGKEGGHLVLSDTPCAIPHDIRFRDANWFLDSSKITSAQVRYRSPHIPGRVSGSTFVPAEPLTEPIAPGQSVVFYDGGEMAGGGIME
ncbi:MAG: aminomethyltransferase beta-barrel domain-containing protein [bacterium]